MGKLRTAFGVILVLLLIAAGIWITVEAVDKDPAIFGSVVAATGAVVLAVFQRRWEKRQELERLHREETSPVYTELVDRFKDAEKIAAQAQNEEFFKQFTTKLLVHGSGPVIKAWVAWRQTAPPENPEDIRIVLAYEQVLRAIRADLGHDDSALAPGDLLRVYLTDFDEAVFKWQVAQAALVAQTDDASTTQPGPATGPQGSQEP